MTDGYATQIVTGAVKVDEAADLAAWQHLVDSGLVWKLQAELGRQASAMINRGILKAKKIQIVLGNLNEAWAVEGED